MAVLLLDQRDERPFDGGIGTGMIDVGVQSTNVT
jgi:hypothetical protein